MTKHTISTKAPRGEEVRVCADLVFVYADERLAGYGIVSTTKVEVEWLRRPVEETDALELLETATFGLVHARDEERLRA